MFVGATNVGKTEYLLRIPENCGSRETVNQQKQETITKQKNPLRAEQGKILVEYNHCKKKELKNLNEQITKQDDMIERKPVELSNNYLYISGVRVVGLAIVRYLLYNKFKKPKQDLTDVPPSSNVSHANTKIELKRDIFETYLKISITNAWKIIDKNNPPPPPPHFWVSLMLRMEQH